MGPKAESRITQMYKVSSGYICFIGVIIMISSVMINYTYAQDKSTLQLSTNKKTYKLGESVIVTLKNNGKSTLEFSDSTLGLIIQNTKTHQKAGLVGSQVMCELKPRESKTIQWDQKDTEGNQVKTGTYNARTPSATEENSNNISPIAVTTTFTITSSKLVLR